MKLLNCYGAEVSVGTRNKDYSFSSTCTCLYLYVFIFRIINGMIKWH